MSSPYPQVRLAELVATMSLGTDLGLGQPMAHVIRQTLIALRMSELLGLDESERAVVYYAGLLAWVGCHTDAYEQAKWFGDDLTFKADSFAIDEPGLGWLLRHLGAGKPLLARARLGVAFVGTGWRNLRDMLDQPLARRRRADPTPRSRVPTSARASKSPSSAGMATAQVA